MRGGAEKSMASIGWAFLGDDEEITITHRALSRNLFAQGALRLVSWLDKCSSGFYTLEDVKL